jgi:excinuclease ABC subunit C
MEGKSHSLFIQEKVRKLPDKPGVYQFLDFSGEILYIGKAKNVRKRVASYYTRSDQHSFKHEVLVKKIYDIHYILVEDESDALLLENNLIKEYQPRYNILLKDDKTFPWIVITRERFPRVMQTRNYHLDGSEYFGPYTSVMMVRTMLDMIRQLFKLRTCKWGLSKESIEKGKIRRCLEYDLGNCMAPCEGLQSESDYMIAIEQIREILKGNFQEVIQQLKKRMMNYSMLYLYEQAEMMRLKIEALEKYKSKSTIVNQKISHVDVCSMIDDEAVAYVNFMKIVNGAVILSHNIEVIKRIAELKEEILAFVIFDLRERFSSDAKEIIVPFHPESHPQNIKITIPIRGDRKKLLELSERNAMAYKRDRQMAKESLKSQEQSVSVLKILQKDLRLKIEPIRIECFDNSNIQGVYPVASCVVYVSGRPKKSEYRHFNIKSVKGPNDFASMEEIIYRRYSRILQESGTLPDLIIVDGGKGQLTSALNSLEKLGIRNRIAIIGIAKRLEEIYIPDDPVPLYLDKNSLSLKLIQRIRNEAHRFGIDFHRRKRESAMFKSELDYIFGIGDATKEKVLLKWKDLAELSLISVNEIAKVTGMKAAKILSNYFENQLKEKESLNGEVEN